MGRYFDGSLADQESTEMMDSAIRIHQNEETKLDRVSSRIFGQMREATKEERESIDTYVKSISEPAGDNFFDLC